MNIKNTFLTTFCLSFAVGASAQTTFNQSNFIKSGDVFIDNSGEFSTSRNIETGGANKLWDFSAVINDEKDTLEAYNANFKPAIIAFNPNANLIITSDKNDYTLLKVSSNGVELLGQYDIAEQEGQDFNRFFIPFPLSNTTNVTKVSSLSVDPIFLGIDPDQGGILPKVDSIKFDLETTLIYKGMGYGSVKLPSTTITNCIMIQQTDIDKPINYKLFVLGAWISAPANLLALLNFDNDGDTSIAHQWWSTNTGFGFPVVSYSANDSNKYKQIQYSGEKSKLNSINKTSLVEIALFPNPVNDIINVSSNFNSTFDTYQILDITGKQVISGAFNGSTITTNNLTSGVYTLQLNGKNSSKSLFVKN